MQLEGKKKKKKEKKKGKMLVVVVSFFIYNTFNDIRCIFICRNDLYLTYNIKAKIAQNEREK